MQARTPQGALNRAEEAVVAQYENPETRRAYEHLSSLHIAKAVAYGDDGLHPYWKYQVAYNPKSHVLWITGLSEAGLWVGSGIHKTNKEIERMNPELRKRLGLAKYGPVYVLPGYLIVKAIVKSNPEAVIEFPGADHMFQRTVDDMVKYHVNPKQYGVDEEKRTITARGLLAFWEHYIVPHLAKEIP